MFVYQIIDVNRLKVRSQNYCLKIKELSVRFFPKKKGCFFLWKKSATFATEKLLISFAKRYKQPN